MPRSKRPVLPCAFFALTALTPLPSPAQSDPGAATIRDLEQRIEDKTRALKEEIEALKQAREAAARPVAPLAAGHTDPESRALRSQLAETREQLATLQSRMDQQ